MFDDAVIVQSALSAFNNAALVAPAFLWWAVLCAPLFALVYFYGNDFLARIGWTKQNTPVRTCITVVAMTLVWVVLFGGNYGVLRDSATVLPFMVATIVFVGTMFVVSHRAEFVWPAWRTLGSRQKWMVRALVLCGLVMLALSDMHAWWGPLLQIGAVAFGALFGRVARSEMRPIAGTLLIIGATTTAILMQPEFFRFGQLGALTLVHMATFVLMAFAIAGTVALQNVNARGRIHRSAYVKLKWMMRFVSALGIVLFIMTESVPVFLGMMVAFGLSFALTIWHGRRSGADLANATFAIALMTFGAMTVMPVITALGLMWHLRTSNGGVMRGLRDLL